MPKTLTPLTFAPGEGPGLAFDLQVNLSHPFGRRAGGCCHGGDALEGRSRAAEEGRGEGSKRSERPSLYKRYLKGVEGKLLDVPKGI